MDRLPPAPRLSRLGRLSADVRGTAAIEFAFIAMTLLVLMVGALDLTAAFVIQRDIKRVSVEIAQGLSSCGRSQDCMMTMMKAVNDRTSNIFVGFSDATLGIALITRKSGAIQVQAGVMTYLPPDIDLQAKTALPDDGDCGVANQISYRHTPLLLAFSSSWGLKVMDMRSYTVQLSYKDCKWI